MPPLGPTFICLPRVSWGLLSCSPHCSPASSAFNMPCPFPPLEWESICTFVFPCCLKCLFPLLIPFFYHWLPLRKCSKFKLGSIISLSHKRMQLHIYLYRFYLVPALSTTFYFSRRGSGKTQEIWVLIIQLPDCGLSENRLISLDFSSLICQVRKLD